MRVIFVVVLALLAALLPRAAIAGPSGTAGQGSVGAQAGTSGTSVGTSNTSVSDLQCYDEDNVVFRNGTVEVGVYIDRYVDLRHFRFRPSTGEAWVQVRELCKSASQPVLNRSSLQWRRLTKADPGVLAGSVFDEVVRQVPVPEPALSPVGPGFVNLGMWLAVEELPPISVTARAGTVWATTSAEVVSTSFDMGDGTVVVCDGVGDPIPPSMLDSVEASPLCGHTYRSVNGREPFVVTVTTTWRVSWVGSGGAGGDLGTLDRSSSLDYQVLEVQTVGS